MSVDTLKDRVAIHEIVDVSCAALLDYLSTVSGGFLESGPQPVQPSAIDDAWKYNVTVSIEGPLLLGSEGVTSRPNCRRSSS